MRTLNCLISRSCLHLSELQRYEVSQIYANAPVPDIALMDADGKPIHLKDLASQEGIVVGFLHGTYCPQCVQQLNRANRYVEALRPHHVSLAWVLADKPVNIVTWQLAAVPTPQFQMLPDSRPSVKRYFGIGEGENRSDPFVVYVDAQGAMRYVEIPENPHAPPNLDELIAVIEEARHPMEPE